MHADGHVISALMHVSLMHGDGERPLYFLCQLVDITERRRAEAERRAAQARLQAIIDNAPTLIFIKDLEQRYLLVNRRWEELFGVPAERALRRTARDHAARPRPRATRSSTARSSRPASCASPSSRSPGRAARRTATSFCS